jgi:hypothetical protein
VVSTVRRVCRNDKRWRSAAMALRWTAAAMLEAKKGFRRLKAHKQLAALRSTLKAHYEKASRNCVSASQGRISSPMAATSSQFSTELGTFPDLFCRDDYCRKIL